MRYDNPLPDRITINKAERSELNFQQNNSTNSVKFLEEPIHNTQLCPQCARALHQTEVGCKSVTRNKHRKVSPRGFVNTSLFHSFAVVVPGVQFAQAFRTYIIKVARVTIILRLDRLNY